MRRTWRAALRPAGGYFRDRLPGHQLSVRVLPEAIEFTGGSGARGHDERTAACHDAAGLRISPVASLQVWRRAANPREGVARRTHKAALNQFEVDLTNGIAVLAPCNFQDVFHRADDLSTRHTISGGHRSFDVLHVATALHLGARNF